MPKVDIIIRAKGHADWVNECIGSIERNTPDGLYRIILVDDGSSPALDVPLGPDDFMVRHQQSKGAVSATNSGLAISLQYPEIPYVMVMDNDAKVPDGDMAWLDRFIDELEEYDDTGCVGATSGAVSAPQHILAAPNTYTANWGTPQKGGIKDNPEVPYFISFCCLLRKSAVVQTGLWDTRYNPGNYEDTDYALQLRERGWKIRVARSVYIHHRKHGTFAGDLHDLIEKNGMKFNSKWGLGRLMDMGVYTPQQVLGAFNENNA